MILAQAPMEDVTDVVFRQIISECAPPDLYFTEFTNIDGMLSKGAPKVIHRLRYTEQQRPIIAQIWGTDPDKFYEAAKIVSGMGFDGIDINMGCPERSIVKKGACSALIGQYEHVTSIIESIRSAAPELPLSIKTRIGIKEIQTEEWIGFLLKQNLDMLTIHARTVAEMSEVPAHWEEVGKVVELRNKLNSPTRILGNGDVESKADAQEKCAQYGCDGVMIGRGIFHNLYVFDGEKDFKTFPKEEKITHLIRHLSLFDETWGSTKNFSIMKKFYKIYISEFDGASDTRAKLMEFTNAVDTLAFLKTL